MSFRRKSSSRYISFHIALFSFLAVGCLLLKSKLASRYTAEERELERQASIQGSRYLESLWLKRQYTDATGDGFEGALASNISYAELRLDEAQRTKLRQRVEQIIRYLKNATFEGYYGLKTDGLHFTFRLSPAAAKLLALKKAGITNTLTSDPKEVMKELWDSMHALHGRTEAPRLSAVCLDSLSAALSTNNTGWGLLKGRTAQGITMAVEALEPGFTYGAGDASTNCPVSQTSFHFSFLAKMKGSTNAGPIYVSLAWAPQDGAWVPSRMISDRWLGLETLF